MKTFSEYREALAFKDPMQGWDSLYAQISSTIALIQPEDFQKRPMLKQQLGELQKSIADKLDRLWYHEDD